MSSPEIFLLQDQLDFIVHQIVLLYLTLADSDVPVHHQVGYVHRQNFHWTPKKTRRQHRRVSVILILRDTSRSGSIGFPHPKGSWAARPRPFDWLNFGLNHLRTATSPLTQLMLLKVNGTRTCTTKKFHYLVVSKRL